VFSNGAKAMKIKYDLMRSTVCGSSSRP